jgi:hypothetical protein
MAINLMLISSGILFLLVSILFIGIYIYTIIDYSKKDNNCSEEHRKRNEDIITWSAVGIFAGLITFIVACILLNQSVTYNRAQL